MKKVFCLLCTMSCLLSGCAGTDNGVCNKCSSAEKDKKIQELTEQYPVGSYVIKNSKPFTIEKHVSQKVGSFNTVYGVKLENSYFVPYNILLSDYKKSPTESEMLQIAEDKEKELIASRNVIDTLDFYSKYFHLIEDETTGQKLLSMSGCYYNYECEQDMYITVQSIKDLKVDKRCLVTSYSEKSSDKCILARRNAPETKIGWFNFKKYLPEKSVIKTEQQFFDLSTMYEAIWHGEAFSVDWEYDYFVDEWAARQCYKNKEQTQGEKDKCNEEEQEFIEDIAFGKAQKCSVKYSSLYNKFKQYLKSQVYLYKSKEIGDRQQHTKFGAINLCMPDKIGL